MNEFYTKTFADYYDMKAEGLFLKVGEEIDFFKFIFDKYSRNSIKKILDVGCGTGRHYIPLTDLGYEVTGLDLNETMLSKLLTKLKNANMESQLYCKDMRDMDFEDEFDAIICMNSAFMYLLTDDDILKTIKAFHRALTKGGVVIIDIMNFLSLMGRYKETIVDRQVKGNIIYECAIKHSIEDLPAIWNHEEFGIINDNGEIITYHELHKLRMVTYNEMKRFFYETGFQDLKCFGSFTDREEATTNAKRLILVGVK